MKLSKKNRSFLFAFMGLGILIGSLAWEVLERVLSQVGINMALGIGPVGLDLAVFSFSLLINPGALIGIAGGIFLFRFL
jgi:hypothetical protein